MNAEKIRELADSFDPMADPYWTIGQWLAWIVHLHADPVRECSESWKQKGPSFAVEGAALGPFRQIWREISVETQDAWSASLRALKSGAVTASGIDASTGRRREISGLEFLDLEFASIDNAEPQLYRKDDIDKAAPAFRVVRFLAADVLKEFPAKPTQQALEKHPGGAPVKYDWAGGEDRLAQVCEQCGGIPSRSHTAPDWRTKADAYRVVREYLDLDGDGGPSDTVLKERVGPMLDRIDRRMKKVGN
jgi:hypothetical protein